MPCFRYTVVVKATWFSVHGDCPLHRMYIISLLKIHEQFSHRKTNYLVGGFDVRLCDLHGHEPSSLLRKDSSLISKWGIFNSFCSANDY